ncbi:AMP-binding protein [Dactylosporangium sp. NPDC005555]|uniref:AMP-binding protein n=1 Tax=Dactylosporangium sp. NPDC005555 TaxID=3154889 RepID=UPI00339F4BDD
METIRRTSAEQQSANLSNYCWVRHDFTWRTARSWLSGLPDGRGLNIAYEAVDRHAEGPLRDKVALRCLVRNGPAIDLSYDELRRQTSRFANVLDALGVRPGERVFSLLNRGPELYVTVLGALKHTNVLSSLFSAFGPEPIRERLCRGDAVLVVTTPELYERKIRPIRDAVPSLRHVLVTGGGLPPEGTVSLAAALAAAGDRFEIPPTNPQQMALLHFTSGTTGRCFAGGWYLSGDLARRDADGYYWFVGRADDVIKSAGHLIGPFEVESLLMEHPAVAEAAVIGKPDPVAGEVVKAFVTLREGYAAGDDLRLDLLAFARRRLGGMAPKEIAFDQDLPHTRSGKVMRRLLKTRELGLPEGDLPAPIMSTSAWPSRCAAEGSSRRPSTTQPTSTSTS